MTLDNLIERLENGEKVKLPVDNLLLRMLQYKANADYSKFTITVRVCNGIMKIKKVGKVIKKTNNGALWS